MKKKITLEEFNENYIKVKDENEVVGENWCYLYDLYDAPIDCDMRVLDKWIGLKIKDCDVHIKDFWKPIQNYNI